MNPEKMTRKTREALEAAQKEALRRGHQEVDGEHLLAALLVQEDGLVPRILERAQADTAGLRARVDLQRFKLMDGHVLGSLSSVDLGLSDTRPQHNAIGRQSKVRR